MEDAGPGFRADQSVKVREERRGSVCMMMIRFSRKAAKPQRGFYFWLITVLFFVFVIENKGIGH